jgi:hypothetical protein
VKVFHGIAITTRRDQGRELERVLAVDTDPTSAQRWVGHWSTHGRSRAGRFDL